MSLGIRNLGVILAAGLVGLLLVPFLGLATSVSHEDVRVSVQHPLFWTAVGVSLRTTTISLLLIVVSGTPLAWWLATSSSPVSRAVALLVELPIVVPPAVVGVALLETFGRRGLFGPWLEAAGVTLPFTAYAVIVAQVVVSTPFYVQAATSAFRKVEPDMMIVARTLGASPVGAFFRIANPGRAAGACGGCLLGVGARAWRIRGDIALRGQYERPNANDAVGNLLRARDGYPAGSRLCVGPRGARRRSSDRAARAHIGSCFAPGIAMTAWRARIETRVGRLYLDVELEGDDRPIAVVGPNGGGKTTLLRAIVGAHRPNRVGEISIGETRLVSLRDGIDLPSELRNVAYVPQGFGLFPHLRVVDNVAFGLSVGPQSVSRRARRSIALSMLETLGCAHLADRRPGRLSGGEQQRVALARALVMSPRMLLLDEPMSALDVSARREVRRVLADRLRDVGRPTVVVTHDVRDVVALDAEVCVLEGGRITQRGSVDDLTRAPSSAFVAEFVAEP